MTTPGADVGAAARACAIGGAPKPSAPKGGVALARTGGDIQILRGAGVQGDLTGSGDGGRSTR